jgi:hypothetical protein
MQLFECIKSLHEPRINSFFSCACCSTVTDIVLPTLADLVSTWMSGPQTEAQVWLGAASVLAFASVNLARAALRRNPLLASQQAIQAGSTGNTTAPRVSDAAKETETRRSPAREQTICTVVMGALLLLFCFLYPRGETSPHSFDENSLCSQALIIRQQGAPFVHHVEFQVRSCCLFPCCTPKKVIYQ